MSSVPIAEESGMVSHSQTYGVALMTAIVALSHGVAAEDATELPRGEPVDLLSTVRLPEHSLRGTWKKLDGSVICEPSESALLMIPVAVAGSFELDCEFTRRTGKGAIAVVCPVGAPSTTIVVSGWKGSVSGIGKVIA